MFIKKHFLSGLGVFCNITINGDRWTGTTGLPNLNINLRELLAQLLNMRQHTPMDAGNATSEPSDLNTSVLDGNLIDVSIENVNVNTSHILD